MTRLLNCICGHAHAHKSRCPVGCGCRYGTDNRRASDCIISRRAERSQEPGMKALRQVFTPEVIAAALKDQRANGTMEEQMQALEADCESDA
jgi:hypothetical protein